MNSPRTLFIVLSLLLFAVAATEAQPPRRGMRPQGGPFAGAPVNMPAGIKKLADVEYAQIAGKPLLLDLYVAEKPAASQPLLVWIHGGGWQSGDKAQCRPAQELLAHGFAVASINYRLTGEAPFPAQIHDCKAAIRWLRAHAAEYGIDSQRFAAFGSSAGGHLVALVGTSGNAKELEGEVGTHLDQSSAVQAVVDYYGPTDLVQFVQTPGYTSHARADAPEGRLLGGAVLERREAAKQANPITYIDASDPPYFIVHGDQDPVVPLNQSELLNAALKKAGVETKLTILKGAKHGGPEFTDRELIDGVASFLDRHLKPGGPKSAATSRGVPHSVVQENPQARPQPKQTTSRKTLDAFLLNGNQFNYDDGRIKFDGIFAKPSGDGPFPAILISHGKGGGAQGFSADKAREFVKWGFVCIGPNYTHGTAMGPGGRPGMRPGGPPGRFNPADLATQGASEENVNRAEACLDVLAVLPYVDAKRIVAYGNSMGAFVTIGLAGRSPDRLAAAAITAGGVNDRAGYAAPSFEQAAKIRCPVLIVHGDADTTVMPEKSAALKSILDKNRVECRREIIPGGGHNIHQTESAQVYGWMKAWFEEHGALSSP